MGLEHGVGNNFKCLGSTVCANRGMTVEVSQIERGAKDDGRSGISMEKQRFVRWCQDWNAEGCNSSKSGIRFRDIGDEP